MHNFSSLCGALPVVFVSFKHKLLEMKDDLNYIYSYTLYQNNTVAPGYKNRTISSKSFTDVKRGRKCGF
jgi:hypothetical protein